MRYYVVGRNEFGQPFIEAEVTESSIVEDYDKTLTAEQVRADPELAHALEKWTKGDDRLQASDNARSTLEDHGQAVLTGVAEIREAAQLVGDVDDFYCESIRQLAPLLGDVQSILERVVDEMGAAKIRAELQTV